MRSLKGAAGLALAAGLVATAASETAASAPATREDGARRVTAPLVCTRGASGQQFTAMLTMPSSRPSGAKLEVRIDGTTSGKISHTGLYYIHDMATAYLVPTGTRYVEGSAHVVPGSGTPNVRAGARVWQSQGVVHLLLPGHVENGDSYTPPSVVFEVEITAPAGSDVSLRLDRYEVDAHAFLVGDVHTICDPHPRPYMIGTTHVAAPASP